MNKFLTILIASLLAACTIPTNYGHNEVTEVEEAHFEQDAVWVRAPEGQYVTLRLAYSIPKDKLVGNPLVSPEGWSVLSYDEERQVRIVEAHGFAPFRVSSLPYRLVPVDIEIDTLGEIVPVMVDFE
jgi:hypothetical protein